MYCGQISDLNPRTAQRVAAFGNHAGFYERQRHAEDQHRTDERERNLVAGDVAVLVNPHTGNDIDKCVGDAADRVIQADRGAVVSNRYLDLGDRGHPAGGLHPVADGAGHHEQDADPEILIAHRHHEEQHEACQRNPDKEADDAHRRSDLINHRAGQRAEDNAAEILPENTDKGDDAERYHVDGTHHADRHNAGAGDHEHREVNEARDPDFRHQENLADLAELELGRAAAFEDGPVIELALIQRAYADDRADDINRDEHKHQRAPACKVHLADKIGTKRADNRAAQRIQRPEIAGVLALSLRGGNALYDLAEQGIIYAHHEAGKEYRKQVQRKGL